MINKQLRILIPNTCVTKVTVNETGKGEERWARWHEEGTLEEVRDTRSLPNTSQEGFFPLFFTIQAERRKLFFKELTNHS